MFTLCFSGEFYQMPVFWLKFCWSEQQERLQLPQLLSRPQLLVKQGGWQVPGTLAIWSHGDP